VGGLPVRLEDAPDFNKVTQMESSRTCGPEFCQCTAPNLSWYVVVQLARFPVPLHASHLKCSIDLDYSIVISGYSLGGALASIAAMSLKAKFPFSNVSMYTYGLWRFA
jgi:Lipase (class 3)